jgi:hypothetical protein
MNQEALFSMPQESFTTDDYWTPKWIFDALKVQFDLDVACPPALHTRQQTIGTPKRQTASQVLGLGMSG